MTQLIAAFRNSFVEAPKSLTSAIAGIPCHFKDLLTAFLLQDTELLPEPRLPQIPPFSFPLAVCHYLPAMCSYLFSILTW